MACSEARCPRGVFQTPRTWRRPGQSRRSAAGGPRAVSPPVGAQGSRTQASLARAAPVPSASAPSAPRPAGCHPVGRRGRWSLAGGATPRATKLLVRSAEPPAGRAHPALGAGRELRPAAPPPPGWASRTWPVTLLSAPGPGWEGAERGSLRVRGREEKDVCTLP